jgi:hypothetical protein
MGVCFDVSLKRLVSVFVFTLYCVHFSDCPHELVCCPPPPTLTLPDPSLGMFSFFISRIAKLP